MPSAPLIDFDKAPNEVEITKAQCRNECTREDGYLDTVMRAERPFTEDDIEACLDDLENYRYATCGKVKQTIEMRTDALIKQLRSKYRYVPFALKRTTVNNAASECQLKGWNQGKDSADCWIDSFLFSIFANNGMSNLIMAKLNAKFIETDYSNTNSVTPEAKALNDALFFINLYLNLLTNREDIMKRGDPKNLKNFTKWCIVWSMLTYLRLTEPEATYNDFIKDQMELNPTDMTVGRGGNVNVLSYFLGKALPDIYKSHSLTATIYDQVASIANTINSLDIPATKNVYFYALPMRSWGATSDEDKYSVSSANSSENGDKRQALRRLVTIERLKRNTIILEAIVIGYGGHQISVTRCNKNWKFYDNEARETTTTVETLSRVAEKIDMYLTNKFSREQNLIFIYKVVKAVGGGTRKQNKKRRQTRKHR